MFDLRMMSGVAPLGDILFGVGLVMLGILLANFAVIPALVVRDARAGRILGIVSTLGMACVVTVLAVRPAAFHLVVVYYLLAFSTSGLLLGWSTLGRRQTAGRVFAASLFIMLTSAVSHWVIHAPR